MNAHLRAVPPTAAEGAEVATLSPSFEEFYEAHHRRLFVALCLTTGNRHEAEEVMHDTFLRILERWDRVSKLEDLDGYLYRAAMNVFRNRYRRAALAMRKAVHLAPTSDDLAAVEARDEVVRLLRSLIPQQRAAVVLTALLDYSSEEAGRMLGMKASTVRVLAARARAQMKGNAEAHR